MLVEDNRDILDANIQTLTRDGFTVVTATSLKEARARLRASVPDVIVMDVLLPDGNGREFLREIREYCHAPVLFLTAECRSEERIKGLMAGGIDYITKPYDINEFRIRIKNFLSLIRSAKLPVSSLIVGSLKLDMVAQQAFLCDGDMCLSPKEFALLHLFVKNEDRVLSTDYLYEKAWGQVMFGDDYPVKKTVSRLRSKLDESEFLISTHRGAGYCFYRA